ncbi:aminotransferase class I/II-fold pyridoxal phosphate-dependent enzyme [Lentibacillus sp. CBA3610]|uniref:aminotransferase class I/II-fold pyridoxal phosphate-dependent enzyme n=1 Tax=Lentibacillus sp. CBA3610 TaxID=2518176 RepID=UPI00159527EA|nr:aminotransferase class I/II-fold pyridoxal phosphate-dependent enzyme [Lentibacillus sp. CBA3610]QKY70268.1 aminotransferase class I/II-fold pyridoxal phosphate-dependent enzyme [Lentibacillus sp. CBA3610]
MPKYINNRVKDLETPGIRVFSNRVGQLENGVNLTIGEPDFSTPEAVKNAGIHAIKRDLTSYSHNAGLFELRDTVSKFFRERYGFYYNPESEIVITSGASEGIDAVLRTILNYGDEVILPAPIFSAYESLIHLSGAKVVYLDTTDTGFIPDPARLEALITNRTKAIILNYPSNPTGVTISKGSMDQIVNVIEKNDIYVLSDEIYSENSFDKSHQPFAAYSELRDKLFLLHGLSKSHSMTGWRIGFVLGPEEIMNHVIKVHLYNSICASLPSQYAAIEALTGSQDTPAEMNSAYMKRRDFVYKKLGEMGLDVIQPKGAFYIFPSIKDTGLTSLELATRLLEDKHVAVVPGSGFTSYGEGHIRISYANSMENLEEGMKRMEKFINNL